MASIPYVTRLLSIFKFLFCFMYLMNLPAQAASNSTTEGVVKLGGTLQASGTNLPYSSNAQIHTVPSSAVKNHTLKAQAGNSSVPPHIISTYDGNAVKSRSNSSCVAGPVSDFIAELPLSSGKIYPEDCAYSGTNPPVLQWPVGYRDIDTSLPAPWSVTISKGGRPYLSGGSKFPHFQIPSSLPIGDYEWSVSFKLKNGSTVKSGVRHFSINENAAPIPVVTPGMMAEATKLRARPRSLPKGMTRESLLANLQSYASSPFANLRKQASTIASSPITTEPRKRTRAEFQTDLEYSQWISSLNATTTQFGKEFAQLAYVAALTNDTEIKRAGIARLLELVRWDAVNGTTNYTFQDQAARQVLQTLARGYDYFYDDLTPAQRDMISKVIGVRYAQMANLINDIHKNKMNSHGVTNVSFLVNVLILLAGDSNFPFAENALMDVYDSFQAISTALGGDDGAFINGNGYGWYVATLLDTLVTIKTVTGHDLSSIPYYAKYVDYLMAFTAPLYKELMVPFGNDHTYNYMYFGYSHDTLQPYALFTKNGVHQWYFQANPGNLTNQIVRPITYFSLISMGSTPVAAVPPAQHSWFFPEAGLASLTSNGVDAQRSSIAFRSSKSGAYSHSYADQNSFTLVSKGKDMLISSGYYFQYGSAHHLFTKSTRSHNALTFDGGIGQSESASSAIPARPTTPFDSTEASGELYNAIDVNNIAIVTGDASKAYRQRVSTTPQSAWRPLLSNAVRSIAYFRNEQITVIYDWATSATARTWELNFHALSAFQFDTPGMARLNNGGSSICITHHNFPSTMRMTDQFEVPPDKTAPSQYHLRSTANAASQELAAITVIKENCSAQTAEVTVHGTKAQVMIGVKGVEFDKKLVSILAR